MGGFSSNIAFYAISIAGGELSSDTRFHKVKTFIDVPAPVPTPRIFKENSPWSKAENGRLTMHRFEKKRIEDPAFKTLLLFQIVLACDYQQQNKLH